MPKQQRRSVHVERPEPRTRRHDAPDPTHSKNLEVLRDKMESAAEEQRAGAPAPKGQVEVALPRSLERMWRDETTRLKTSREIREPKNIKELRDVFSRIDTFRVDAGGGAPGETFADLLARWDRLIDPFDMSAKIDFDAVLSAGERIVGAIPEIRKIAASQPKGKGADIDRVRVEDGLRGYLARIAEGVKAQLDAIARSEPLPVANPVEALVDSLYEGARTSDVMAAERNAATQRADLVAEERALERSKGVFEAAAARFDGYGDVIAGAAPGDGLRDELAQQLGRLQTELRRIETEEKCQREENPGKDPEVDRSRFETMEFSGVVSDLETFLSSGKLAGALKEAFQQAQENAGTLRDRYAERAERHEDAVKKTRASADKADAVVAQFRQGLDAALDRIEAAEGNPRKVWSDSKDVFDARLKRLIGSATDSDQRKALRDLRMRISEGLDRGLGSAIDDWREASAKAIRMGPQGREFDLETLSRHAEKVRAITIEYRERIDAAFDDRPTLGRAIERALLDAKAEMLASLRATLTTIGSDLNYYYEANLRLQLNAGEPNLRAASA